MQLLVSNITEKYNTLITCYQAIKSIPGMQPQSARETSAMFIQCGPPSYKLVHKSHEYYS